MTNIDEILNRISNQSTSILNLNNHYRPVRQSYSVKAALGYVDILDYLRDGDDSEVRLFRNNKSDKLITKSIEPPTPLRVKPQSGKEFDINVLLNAAIKIINDYRPLPRTKQHIEHLRTQVVEIQQRIKNYQNIIDSPLDASINQLSDTLDSTPRSDADSPQELIRVQTEQVNKMQAKLLSLKKRKEILQATVQAQKLEAHKPQRQAPPTPIQFPLRQMKEIQRRANTPRKPKLATDRRELEIMKGLPHDQEDSFKMGGEDTLNTSTLLGKSAADMNLMPSTPMAAPGDMLMDMDTPQPRPPQQPQLEQEEEESIDLTVRKPTPSSSPEFEPPPKLKDIDDASTTPTETPREKTPLPAPAEPSPSPSPNMDTAAIEVTPEIKAAIELIWDGFGDVLRPKSETEHGDKDVAVPDLTQMVQLLRSEVDSVPAAAQTEPGSPTHSILSIASSLTNKEANSPQTATSAALLLKLLTSPANRLPMPEAKDHLGQLIHSKGWSAELTTKSIYALVGKRLLQLDRKGASATLRFRI